MHWTTASAPAAAMTMVILIWAVAATTFPAIAPSIITLVWTPASAVASTSSPVINHNSTALCVMPATCN